MKENDANYKLIIRPEAEKSLSKIIISDFNKICEAILKLENLPRPHGVENLIENFYRIRIGNYRVIYMIDEKNKTIDIGKIARRSENTYKDIKSLFKTNI